MFHPAPGGSPVPDSGMNEMSSVFTAGGEARLSHTPPVAAAFAAEPTLDDILADPLVALILRRDGLTVSAVRARLDRERRRLAEQGAASALRRAA